MTDQQRDTRRQLRRQGTRPLWTFNPRNRFEYNEWLDGSLEPLRTWAERRSTSRTSIPNYQEQPNENWEEREQRIQNERLWKPVDIYVNTITQWWTDYLNPNISCRTTQFCIYPTTEFETATTTGYIVRITGTSKHAIKTVSKMFETYHKWHVIGIQITESNYNCDKVQDTINMYTLKISGPRCGMYQYIRNMLTWTNFVQQVAVPTYSDRVINIPAY